MPAPTTNPPNAGGGLKIIHAAMMRSGTASLAQAYTKLGYKVHHALEHGPWNNHWPKIEDAAEATWPEILVALPGYTYKDPATGRTVPRPRFTHENWDAIWGEYEVVTDLASPFVLELIAAYPEAKVVVVEREFGAWWPSFEERVLDTLFTRFGWLQRWIIWNVFGIRAMHAMRKVHAGFFGTAEFSKESIVLKARGAHEEFYRKVREAVPAERRLEYTLGSGWEPLCAFLDKDIPHGPFPYVNTRGEHRETIMSGWARLLVVPMVVGAAAIVGVLYSSG